MASRSAKPLIPGMDRSGFALLEVLPLGVLVTNRSGRITYSNPASQKLFGVSASTLIGTVWWLAVDARDRAAVTGWWQTCGGDGPPGIFEVRLATGFGNGTWTRHSIAGLGPDAACGSHIHTIEDISRAREAERSRIATLEALSTERERARVTLDCIGDAVISTDARGQVTYLNTVAEDLCGWSRSSACGQPLGRVFKVIDSRTGKLIRDPAEMAIESLGIVQMPANSVLLRPDGSELAIEDSAAPIFDQVGRLTGAVVIFRDRKLSRENTAIMEHLARHDALTGLANRLVFSEHFEQALKLARRHNNRVGLLFIDLDQFKQINDSLGHEAGDRLLRAVARDLTACVRGTDLVCRHGGDEFVVLLSEIGSPDDACNVAKKMKDSVANPRPLEGCSIGLELSIGISIFPDDGADMETLMHLADTAMYHAKLDPSRGPCLHHEGMKPRSMDGESLTQRPGRAAEGAGPATTRIKRGAP